MTGFIVTGTPRSGTTHFCKTLNQKSNIFLPNSDHMEPLDLWNDMKNEDLIIDEDQFIQDQLSKVKGYWGFKAFDGKYLSTSVHDLAQRNGLYTFCLIRKDIRRAFLSFIVHRYGHIINQDDFYEKWSSVKYDKKIDFNLQQIRSYAFFLVKHYYMMETKTHGLKIYFEDLISSPEVSIPEVNEYFNQEIVFKYDYQDSPLEYYFQDYEKMLQPLKDILDIARKQIDLPDYLRV